MDVMRVVYSWQDFTGEKADIGQICSLAREFDPIPTICFLAKISFLLSPSDERVQQEAILALLHPLRKARLTELNVSLGTRGRILSRMQLLNLMKILFQHGKGSRTPNSESDRRSLGDLLLMVEDLVRDKDDFDWVPGQDLVREPSRTFQMLASRFLLENEEDYTYHQPRYYRLMFEHLPGHFPKDSSSRAESIDLAFMAKHGCSMRDLFILASLIYAFNAAYSLEQFRSRQPGIPLSTLHKSLTWDSERIRATLQVLCVSAADYGRRISQHQQTRFDYDFDFLRRRPLIQYGDEIIILDRQFLINACGEVLLEYDS